jgi:hypothetical protein
LINSEVLRNRQLHVAANRHAQVQNRHNVKKQARESNFFRFNRSLSLAIYQ